MDRIDVTVERRGLARPLRVSHTTVDAVEVVSLTITRGALRGRGEVTVGPWRPEPAGDVAFVARQLVAELPLPLVRVTTLDRLLQRAASVSPAARLLAEMAVLDLLARGEGVPLATLLELPTPPAIPLWQTVSLDDPPRPAADRRLKVKLGGPRDEAVLAALAGADGQVLVDVNRGWSAATCERLLPLLARVPLVALEDPVHDRDVLPRLRARLGGVPLVLDEGVATADDVAAALRIAGGVNVKLLKAGGLLEARRALDRVADAGALAVLGCFVETPATIAYAAQLAGRVAIADLDGHLFLDGGAAAALHLDASAPGAARLRRAGA